MKKRMDQAHPRLLFTKEAISSLDPSLPLFETLRRSAEKLKAVPLYTEEYANSEYTQHGKFYELGAQIMSFAGTFGALYAAGETGYEEKMKEALLHYASFRQWAGPANKDRKVPWHSELSTTRMLYGFALAYDTMYDAFTPEERKVIRGAMIRLGIRPLLEDWVLPGHRIHALDSMGHNWWAVCIAFAGIGILSILDEEPECGEWLPLVDRALEEFCTYGGATLLNKVPNFDERGMFYESAGYFNYGAGELCRYLFVRKNVLGKGTEDFPVLRLIPAAFLSLSVPAENGEKIRFVNFGDSDLNGVFDLLPRWLLLLGYGDVNFRRFYAKLKKADTILDLIYPEAFACDGEAPVYPAREDYPGTGLAFLRDGDEELAVRCGFTWNHAHDDGGSFLLFADGEDVLCDSGTVSYGKSDYVRHYCGAEAHSVVKVGGKGQFEENSYRGSRYSGTVRFLAEDCLLADATGPMCDRCLRNFRTFFRLDRGLYAFVDEIVTYAETDFEWLLHYRGTLEGGNGSFAVRTGKNTVRVLTVSPDERETEIREHDGVKYLALTQKKPSRYFHQITVLSRGEDAVTAEPLDGPDSYGCTVRKGGKEFFLVFNYEADGRRMHVNSNNVLNGYGTDAYLLAGSETELTVVYGSYLREGERSLFESFDKKTVTLKRGRS